MRAEAGCNRQCDIVYRLQCVIICAGSPECVYIEFVADLCADVAMTSATCWVTRVMRLSTCWHILATQCHTHFTGHTIITVAIRQQWQICSNMFTAQKILKIIGNVKTNISITTGLVMCKSVEMFLYCILKEMWLISGSCRTGPQDSGNCSFWLIKWQSKDSEMETQTFQDWLQKKKMWGGVYWINLVLALVNRVMNLWLL
jgi:hypothetical protein